MKMRYYLRGLGLGILFTAVFFLIGGESGQTMSDEMIKERARELGMMESTVLADIPTSSAEDTLVEDTSEEDASMEDTSDEDILEKNTSVEETSKEDTSVEETTVENTEEATEEATTEENVDKEADTEEIVSEEGTVISIVVNKGEGSDTVSRHLYEAGLIDDAQAYDKYLMQNGYDRKIGAGEHLIPTGSDWETIAKLLCR